MAGNWTKLVPLLLRLLFWMCALSAVLFAVLAVLSVSIGSPARTVITFVAFALLETYVCRRVARWRQSFPAARGIA